jgi:hypothetical protein
VARSPAPNANSVGLSASVTATFSEAVSAGSIVFELRDGANAVVPASVSYDATSLTARLAPTDPLVPGTYTARVSGATDAAGNAMAGTDTWSFSTPTCPCSLWNDATTPTTASAGDTSSIELGVKVRSSAPGYVTGVRFYKGSANTGTHVANLWASDGTLLASAVFTNETATGWQQVSFAAPVAISANTTYIASYHAPTGGYAYDGGYFGGAYQSGPLSALADAEGGNGLYRYGGSGFPSQSYGATNYWVDVVYGTAAP